MTDNEREQQLRIDLMTIQIERLRQELKMENRKFLLATITASAALLGAGAAIGAFVATRLFY